MKFRTELILSANDLPDLWNEVVAKTNILLSEEFLKALQESQPLNMQNYFSAFYLDDKIIGGVLLQYLDFRKHDVFSEKSFLNLNNSAVKIYAGELLIVGNNLVTGQNGFYFNLDLITKDEAIKLLANATELIQKKVRKADLVLFKDFEKLLAENLEYSLGKDFKAFSVQPNMILDVDEHWKTYGDYLQSFSTKYRTRAKSARKKLGTLEKKELNLELIEKYQKVLYHLYLEVAEEADFNTFILPENHFYALKKNLQHNFKVFAYIQNHEIVSFYSLFINYEEIDTYFLGYSKIHQKPQQLYLNMLLDMVEFGIINRKKSIIFGRTALEIKSTIGAKPQEIYGLIKHRNYILNLLSKTLITRLNPSKNWVQRSPFKQ